MNATESEIRACVARAVIAFMREFERTPTDRERMLLAGAITRHFMAPNAPSTRLH